MHSFARSCNAAGLRCVSRTSGGAVHYTLGCGGRKLSGVEGVADQPAWIAAAEDRWGFLRIDADGHAGSGALTATPWCSTARRGRRRTRAGGEEEASGEEEEGAAGETRALSLPPLSRSRLLEEKKRGEERDHKLQFSFIPACFFPPLLRTGRGGELL